MQTQRKLTMQSLAALLLVGILCVFLLSAGVKFLLRRLPGVAQDTAAGEVHAVEIDWAARYPFSDAQSTETLPPMPEKTGLSNLLDGYQTRVDALKASLETYATDDILLHDTMTEAANAYDKLLGWNIQGVGEYNALVTLSDGYLATVFPAHDVTGITADISAFAAEQAGNGTPVLYVQGPFKINSSDTGVYGVVDFTNQNADTLVNGLRDAGTNVLDLREEMMAAGKNEHAAFFRTDHHWLPETGLWAAGRVAQRLNDDFDFDIDLRLLAENGYTKQVYSDWFLGSQGQKATLANCDPEDFTLLYPVEDAGRYTLSIPTLGVEKTGGFEVLYQMSMLGTQDYYGDAPYSVYFYSDVPLRSVHNETVQNGKRLLVLSDSFGNTFTPFLSRGIGQIDAIDLRYFTGSLTAYLAENAYDAIVILYSADMLGYDTATPDSHTGWHDFR